MAHTIVNAHMFIVPNRAVNNTSMGWNDLVERMNHFNEYYGTDIRIRSNDKLVEVWTTSVKDEEGRRGSDNWQDHGWDVKVLEALGIDNEERLECPSFPSFLPLSILGSAEEGHTMVFLLSRGDNFVELHVELRQLDYRYRQGRFEEVLKRVAA